MTRSLLERVIERALFLSAALSIVVTAGIIAVLLTETLAFLREMPDHGIPVRDRLDAAVRRPAFRRPAAGDRNDRRLCHRDVRGAAGRAARRDLSEPSTRTPGVRRTLKPVLEILAGVPDRGLWLLRAALRHAAPAAIHPGSRRLQCARSRHRDGHHDPAARLVAQRGCAGSVPNGLREGAFALGATRLQTSLLVVVPAAFSGISAAAILAVSRAIGETMIVAIAAGQQPRLTANPLVPIETMTAYIVQVSMGDTPAGTLEYRTIFAVGHAALPRDVRAESRQPLAAGAFPRGVRVSRYLARSCVRRAGPAGPAGRTGGACGPASRRDPRRRSTPVVAVPHELSVAVCGLCRDPARDSRHVLRHRADGD